jgi:signal peptidase I
MIRRSRWPLSLYRVEGGSMMPTYKTGDVLIGFKWSKRLKPGLVVVAQTPERIVIKRIKRIGQDSVWLEGDNPDFSSDSRNFGPLAKKVIQAVIIAKLP